MEKNFNYSRSEIIVVKFYLREKLLFLDIFNYQKRIFHLRLLFFGTFLFLDIVAFLISNYLPKKTQFLFIISSVTFGAVPKLLYNLY